MNWFRIVMPVSIKLLGLAVVGIFYIALLALASDSSSSSSSSSRSYSRSSSSSTINSLQREHDRQASIAENYARLGNYKEAERVRVDMARIENRMHAENLRSNGVSDSRINSMVNEYDRKAHFAVNNIRNGDYKDAARNKVEMSRVANRMYAEQSRNR